MKLKPSQMTAIHLLVYSNHRKQDIAAEVGVTKDTLSNWLRNDDFLNEYHRTIREKVDTLASAAISRIGELMYSRVDSVALAAAKDIASRAGYDATDKKEIKVDGTLIKVDYGE
jgi:hypothetical protein